MGELHHASVGRKEAIEIDPELAENQLIFPNAETLANAKIFKHLTTRAQKKYNAAFQAVRLGS